VGECGQTDRPAFRGERSERIASKVTASAAAAAAAKARGIQTEVTGHFSRANSRGVAWSGQSSPLRPTSCVPHLPYYSHANALTTDKIQNPAPMRAAIASFATIPKSS